jgi:hypothetical protein
VWALVCAAVLAGGPAEGQKPLSPLDMSLGRTDDNFLSGPVLDGRDGERVSFESLDWQGGGDALVRRRKNQKVRYTAGEKLGAHLADAMTSEARALGLETGDGGWRVGGSIDEIAMDERRITYGPHMFYSYMGVTLRIESPSGETASQRYRVHEIYWRYNAGFGARDEALEALATFVVDSAQELVVRLNMDFFGNPPASRIAAIAIDAGRLDDQRALIREVGLSGSADGASALLGLLLRTSDESERADILNGLALLQSEESASLLMGSYASEGEDARFFALKALDYLGGEARDFAIEQGSRDEEESCRLLAERVRRHSGE